MTRSDTIMKIDGNMYLRYWMFSMEHLKKLQELEKKSGNLNYHPGTVLVSGTFKKYTFMTIDPESYSKRYSDARIVASGDIRKTTFTEGD